MAQQDLPTGLPDPATAVAKRRRGLTVIRSGGFLVAASLLLFVGLYVIFPARDGSNNSFFGFLAIIFVVGVTAIIRGRRILVS